MRPVIGITPLYSYEDRRFWLPAAYWEAVYTAGGLPAVVYPCTDFPHYIEGLVFSGGGDIDPVRFGEEPLPQVGEISPLRDAFEIPLCKKALTLGVPILGICRGMQVLCAATGGSIFQDIPAQTGSNIKHSQDAPRFYGTHAIELAEDSRLYALLRQRTAVVNSFHHQAVRQVGEGFRVSARSRDGLIEAMESTAAQFAMGVQWHPEAMHESVQQALFQGFIAAAAIFAKGGLP